MQDSEKGGKSSRSNPKISKLHCKKRGNSDFMYLSRSVVHTCFNQL